MTDQVGESNGLINNGDGITFKYLATVIETSIFATGYKLQNKINEKRLYRRNISTALFQNALDYAHLVPFLVHRWGYGRISLAWAQFATWIQLQLPILSYDSFAIAFWVTVIVLAGLLGMLIYIGASQWNKLPATPTVISIAAFSLTNGFQVFFPVAFYLLFTPWFCDPHSKTLFVITGTDCFGSANIVSIIFGTFGTFCLLGLSLFSAFIKSSVEPINNDFTITSGITFKIQYYFTVAFMTVNRFWISPALGVEGYGSWWEALFNLLAVSLLCASLLYYLPYQIPEANQLRGIFLFSVWWISCVTFMMANIPENIDHVDRQIDYILLTGMGPFLIFGNWIVKARLAHMESFAASLILETKVASENKKRAAQKAAELNTEVKKTGPKVVGAKKDAAKDQKAKDAKGKDAKGNKDAGGAKSTKAESAKTEADNAASAAQKAAMAALDQRLEDDEKKRNTRLYLPKIFQEYQAGVTTIDIVGRILWHYSDDKTSLEAANTLYESAEKAYPEVPYVKVLRVSYCTSQASDPSVHLPKLDLIKKMEPGILSRYYVYKRTVDIRDRAKVSSVSEGENTLDLVAYIEFQNLFRETKKYNNRAIESIREFWMLFLQKSITSTAFHRAAKDVDLQASRAMSVYKTMMTKFPKNPQVLTSYAYFLDLVLRNTEEAQRSIRRADEQKAREAEEARNGNVAGQIDSQAVVAITEDASIDQVNKALLDMYGYTRNEVLGRNIKLLVPSPWKEKHDGILARYRATGIAKVIGVTQTLYGQHKEGYGFSMKLLVQERRKENGERNFIGMIQQTNQDSKFGVVIISEMGIIKMVTKKTLELFGGYRASELLNKNVIVLMIDSFAAGHDNYLKRYRDTGEARVIGTAGRNVPAKRKDGTTFPAALTVEEGYADGERFFLANLQDTSSTEGIIFIDGFGTIQNIDNGISQLLGYKKEGAVGKNIKMLMPSPYCDYHDMYLERYRRTKVSNVLRSQEGRMFPALHADGSVVTIKALITRADSGETGSNLLFKGIIRRGNTAGSGLTGGRRGYLESYELEMNKAGIIVKLNRKILSMLGHPQDRPISDFIGQPIEVLIPVLPDRPSQAKSFWFTTALRSPDLNFYLIACNKNYTLLPISFCLDERPDGAIRMRIRDLSELDALLTIDEIGNVLKMNEDAFMLLGFEPDETIGRNIKYIQSQEVADQHDYYLQRYKDTGVARVVGIARTVDTIHRDTTVFPIEIQVTEQIKPDGTKNFIGRLRHRKIEERCEKDLITRYVVNTKSLGTTLASLQSGSMTASNALQSSNSVGSDGRRMKFKGKKGSSKGSSALASSGGIGVAALEEQHSVLSNSLNSSSHGSSRSGGSSSVSSNTKFMALLAKLKFVKNSNKEDPSLSQFGTVLNVILAVYVIFFIIGLVVTNTIQTPVPYYELMQNLQNTDVVINQVITAARLLELTIDDEITVTNCAWEISHMSSTRPLCPWIKAGIEAAKARDESFRNGSLSKILLEDGSTDFSLVPQYTMEWMLGNYSKEMVYRTHKLKEEYAKIRSAGDVFDQAIQGQFEVNRFVSGDSSSPELTNLVTFWNVLGTVSSGIDSLKATGTIDEASERDWAFIVSNRYRLVGFIKTMCDLIPPQATTTINNNMIFHLIMAIVSIIIGLASFFLLVLPKIRQVQADRERVLRLLILMPKSVIYDLVHRVYVTSNSEEEEEDNGKTEEDEEEDEEEEDQAEGAESESQEITVLTDRSLGIYITFIVGLLVLSLPPIVHAIYRFIDNTDLLKTVDLLKDLNILYLNMGSLSWQIFAGYFDCPNKVFCAQPFDKGVHNFEDAIDTLEHAYIDAVSIMQGYPRIIDIFTQSQCFDTPNGLYRCVTRDSLYFPENFVSKTHNGYSNLVQNFIRSARKYATRVLELYSVNKIPEDIREDTSTEADFHFLYEIPLLEGEAGAYQAIHEAVLILDEEVVRGILAANISYAVGLAASFIIFLWVFGAIRKSIIAETKYARGVLYMVPYDVLRNTKAMIEYIENLHAALSTK